MLIACELLLIPLPSTLPGLRQPIPRLSLGPLLLRPSHSSAACGRPLLGLRQRVRSVDRERLRSYSVPGGGLSLRLGPHYSPGALWDAAWNKQRIVQPRRGGTSPVSISLLDQANNPRRLVVHNDDSNVSSCAYPYSTLLGGMHGWIPWDRLSLPLHPFESQSPRWGECITLASRGEESHLYHPPVIKDLLVFASHP